MKFSDYFFSTGTRVSAVTVGIASGGLIGLLTRWEYGVLCGVAAAVLTTVLMPLAAYLQNLPFERIKSKLPGPFHFDEQVMFRSPKGVFGGYFLLNDSSLILLTREKRGRICMELKRQDVRSVCMDPDGWMRIFLSDTQYICVLSEVDEEIMDFLGQNGWNIAKNG